MLFVYVNPLSGVGYVSVKRTYPTPDSGLTHLFDGRQCSLQSVRLVTPDCTCGVIDPL